MIKVDLKNNLELQKLAAQSSIQYSRLGSSLTKGETPIEKAVKIIHEENPTLTSALAVNKDFASLYGIDFLSYMYGAAWMYMLIRAAAGEAAAPSPETQKLEELLPEEELLKIQKEIQNGGATDKL